MTVLGCMSLLLRSNNNNNKNKILWDFNVYMDRHISARRPDIVYIDKNAKVASVIDIAVSDDHHVKDKENRKG